MYTQYNLDEGTKVDVPLLDGVIERALKLIDEWIAKKPELEAAPSHLLFFNAVTCSDLVRTIDAFQKAGLNEELTLRFAHSRFPEVLMYAGVTALLGINTWWLDNKIENITDPPNGFGLTRDDALGKDRFKKCEPWDELRTSAEFNVELTRLVGPEATELLFQACRAYDKWAREQAQKSVSEACAVTKPGVDTESIKKLEFKTEQPQQPEPEIIPTPEIVLNTEQPMSRPMAQIVKATATPTAEVNAAHSTNPGAESITEQKPEIIAEQPTKPEKPGEKSIPAQRVESSAGLLQQLEAFPEELKNSEPIAKQERRPTPDTQPDSPGN
jgi:hypothetical protein